MEKDQSTPLDDQAHKGFFDQVVQFAVKTAVFVFLVSLGIKWVAPDFRQGVSDRLARFSQELGRDETRLLLSGFLVRNPALHWRLSDFKERQGNLAGAEEDIELALGLLEMNRAEPVVLRRYQERLDGLRRMRQPAAGGQDRK